MTGPEPPAPRKSPNAVNGSDRKGADLARDALAAAREQNAARRKATARNADANPKGRRSGSAASLKRRRWSGSGPDSRDPAPLGATMKRWLGDAAAGTDLIKAMVLGRWTEIVGAEVADHCEPVSLVDGELLLRAESTAWATQLRMLAPQIVAKINREVGHGSVLRIRAQGPSGPSWRFGTRHVSGRGPRDTYG
jgi:predicted nucleic acid-binding Zn ribbon protein